MIRHYDANEFKWHIFAVKPNVQEERRWLKNERGGGTVLFNVIDDMCCTFCCRQDAPFSNFHEIRRAKGPDGRGQTSCFKNSFFFRTPGKKCFSRPNRLMILFFYILRTLNLWLGYFFLFFFVRRVCDRQDLLCSRKNGTRPAINLKKRIFFFLLSEGKKISSSGRHIDTRADGNQTVAEKYEQEKKQQRFFLCVSRWITKGNYMKATNQLEADTCHRFNQSSLSFQQGSSFKLFHRHSVCLQKEKEPRPRNSRGYRREKEKKTITHVSKVGERVIGLEMPV